MHPLVTPQEKEEARWRRFSPLVLVLAGILAYANSFSGVFLYDDPGSIVQNLFEDAEIFSEIDGLLAPEPA